ncbi:hypothetical protein K435DRAFT_810461 [Dendrothele bispora CBS 962.96]|uniref:Uncharacterized protein n=1 Tax=Dendrothele bispora (strain CBS 962.96) TaxID=1314807 RepID=A0A4S8KUZ9_DENBC|nr:hypothetical protein K435DRAFT_810461 [Dendrothele bispora CBS 962.96]
MKASSTTSSSCSSSSSSWLNRFLGNLRKGTYFFLRLSFKTFLCVPPPSLKEQTWIDPDNTQKKDSKSRIGGVLLWPADSAGYAVIAPNFASTLLFAGQFIHLIDNNKTQDI